MRLYNFYQMLVNNFCKTGNKEKAFVKVNKSLILLKKNVILRKQFLLRKLLLLNGIQNVKKYFSYKFLKKKNFGNLAKFIFKKRYIFLLKKKKNYGEKRVLVKTKLNIWNKDFKKANENMLKKVNVTLFFDKDFLSYLDFKIFFFYNKIRRYYSFVLLNFIAMKKQFCYYKKNFSLFNLNAKLLYLFVFFCFFFRKKKHLFLNSLNQLKHLKLKKLFKKRKRFLSKVLKKRYKKFFFFVRGIENRKFRRIKRFFFLRKFFYAKKKFFTNFHHFGLEKINKNILLRKKTFKHKIKFKRTNFFVLKRFFKKKRKKYDISLVSFDRFKLFFNNFFSKKSHFFFSCYIFTPINIFNIFLLRLKTDFGSKILRFGGKLRVIPNLTKSSKNMKTTLRNFVKIVKKNKTIFETLVNSMYSSFLNVFSGYSFLTKIKKSFYTNLSKNKIYMSFLIRKRTKKNVFSKAFGKRRRKKKIKRT